MAREKNFLNEYKSGMAWHGREPPYGMIKVCERLLKFT
jgi:hypothetical protein